MQLLGPLVAKISKSNWFSIVLLNYIPQAPDIICYIGPFPQNYHTLSVGLMKVINAAAESSQTERISGSSSFLGVGAHSPFLHQVTTLFMSNIWPQPCFCPCLSIRIKSSAPQHIMTHQLTGTGFHLAPSVS